MKHQLTNSRGFSYSIGPDGLSIGRARTNDVILTDRRVSRIHASIRFIGGRYWVRDEKSRGGTFVNGTLVPGQQELKAGDILQIGSVTFWLAPATPAGLAPAPLARTKRNQLVYVGIAGALLIIFVVMIASARGNGKIIWQTGQADFSLRSGTTSNTMIEFTPTSDMSGLTVMVSSELTDMLRVDLEEVPSLEANQKYALVLIAQAPVTKKTGFFQGEVYFSTNGRSVEERLPVRINIIGLSSDEIPPTVGNPSEDRIVADESGQTLIKDELVVGLNFETVDPSERAKEIAKSTKGVFLGSIPDTLTYQIIYEAADLNQLESIRQRVMAMTDVDFASHDLITESYSKMPNDTSYDSWDESAPAGNNWHLEFINAPSAWDLTTGSSAVNIAVIDNEIDKDHEDLNDNIVSVDGTITPAGGHGTHVAGIICAEGNNKQGVTGVMWDCTIRGYDFGPSRNSTASAQEKMVQAINDGARIVNMSLQWIDNNKCGTAGTDATLELVTQNNAILARSILYAQRENKDVLWVFAAGNECRDAAYASPASLTGSFPLNTITVASVNQNGDLSDFSNYGDLVTVAAPGGNKEPHEDIYSTLPHRCILWVFCKDKYGGMAGTSMAAPEVTGLAGLVLSQHPDFSSSQIKQCILSGAESAGKEVSGQEFKTINAVDSVKCEGKVKLPAKVDIVFAIDLTGSMGEELERIKIEVRDIVREITTVASPSTDFQFGLVSYEDYPGSFDSRSCPDSSYSDIYGKSDAKVNGDEPFRVDLLLTDDVNALYSIMPTLTLGDGQDAAESYARVFWELGRSPVDGKFQFRDDALRLVVNFGDSVPHDPNLNQGIDSPPKPSFDTGIDPGKNGIIDCGGDDIDLQVHALPAMVSSKVHLLHIDSSGDTTLEPYWRYWTSLTGGAYAAINQDGTIPGDLNLPELIMDLLRLIAEKK